MLEFQFLLILKQFTTSVLLYHDAVNVSSFGLSPLHEMYFSAHITYLLTLILLKMALNISSFLSVCH